MHQDNPVRLDVPYIGCMSCVALEQWYLLRQAACRLLCMPPARCIQLFSLVGRVTCLAGILGLALNNTNVHRRHGNLLRTTHDCCGGGLQQMPGVLIHWDSAAAYLLFAVVSGCWDDSVGEQRIEG